jgi:putative drug exporter of the RND superfamily
MGSLGFTGRLAAWSARHRWYVVGFWVAFVLVLSAAAQSVGGVFTTDIEFTNEPESQAARNLLDRYRGSPPLFEQIIVRSDTYTVDDPEFEAHVNAITAALRVHPEAIVPQQVFSYYDTGVPELVSANGRTTIVPALLVGDIDTVRDSLPVLEDALEPFKTADSFEVLHGGYASINEAFNAAAEEDLSAELQVLPVALLILVLVFGAVVAALVPMVVAFVSIGIAMALATLISEFYALSTFVTNMIMMIGLAVGIDYALFVIARFREQRRLGQSLDESIQVAGDTASRAVFFSGLTVVIGLMGMMIVPTSIFRSFAIGASMVVIFAVVTSLTLVPAGLSLLGDNVNRVKARVLFIFLITAAAGGGLTLFVADALGLPARAAGPIGAIVIGIPAAIVIAGYLDRHHGFGVPFLGDDDRGRDAGFWSWMTRFVMARPLPMAILSAGLLVALAIPYFSMELGAGGASSLPERFEARQAFEILNDEFSAGRLAPTDVAIRADDISAPEVQAAIGQAMAMVAADPAMSLISDVEVMADNRVAVFSLSVPGDSASPEALDAIERLRGEILPTAFAGSGAEALVGGDSAMMTDFFALVDTYTPIVFSFVLGFAFILLLLIFRSVVIPLKSIIMNLLSVGAAYGVMVMVFQWGWAPGFLGFAHVAAIDAWIPLLMFTILFGLSMDYHIFLLSRIRERFDETHDNRESVAFGLRQTANIITGAAAIMVAVFGGFALGELPMMQMMGLGLAVSVFLDATIVRSILVPSSMSLLGDWNWYLPRWLEWLPDLRVEREPLPVPVEVAADSFAAGGGS